MIEENKKEVVEALKNAAETDELNLDEMDATEGGFLNRCSYTQHNNVAGCGVQSLKQEQQAMKPTETLIG